MAFTPSATLSMDSCISTQDRPLASCSPTKRFLLRALEQVATTSPRPANPANVSGSAPAAIPKRVISAKPRVMTVAFAFCPASIPSAIPAARATMFLRAPASSTPWMSVLV